MAQAMSVASNSVIDEEKIRSILSDLSIDTTRASERVYTISANGVSLNLQVLDEGYIMSYVTDDDEIMAYVVTTEMRDSSSMSPINTSKSSEPNEKVVFINGTETFVVPMDNFVSPTTDSDCPYNPQPSRGTTNYWWDNLYFIEYTGLLHYAHPDKTHYDIDPYSPYVAGGKYLVHFQVDYSTSSDIVQYFYDLGDALGFVFGWTITFAGLGGSLMASIAGQAVAIALGPLFSIIFTTLFCDADGCIWFWINLEFFNYVYDMFYNPYNWYFYPFDGSFDNLVSAVAAGFCSFGYLRIGSTTFFDKTSYPHIGDPTPPLHYYGVSVVPSKTGDGYYTNENNVLGAIDGNYAYLNSGSYGNKAELTVTLSNTPVTGQLYLQCYTPTSTGANLKVYVCHSGGVWNPNPVVNTNLYPPNNPTAINCGYAIDIVAVSIVAYHQYYINGVYYPSYIYVDAVCLMTN